MLGYGRQAQAVDSRLWRRHRFGRQHNFRMLIAAVARPLRQPGVRYLCWLAMLACGNAHADDNVTQRPAWTASRVSGTPDPAPPYRVELAYPKLTFERPLLVTHNPSNGRLLVAEQGARIYSFEDEADTDAADLVADLRKLDPPASAIYGFAFHPNFARNRRAYVCYITQPGRDDGTVVSEFLMRDAQPATIDLASERRLITWYSGGHNGGCLKFGPDGYLYISAGDGAGPDPPDPDRVGQDLSTLLSTIMRIDVDRSDDSTGAYSIPEDNPFVGNPRYRPEIWAYGLRNPWRMSFDARRGDLWVGDVGWQLWEMVYRVQRGGNYGWAIMEGPQAALPLADRGPTPIVPPTLSHPHSEAASFTGGYVYYGTRLPELQGAYIYGDFQSGIVWGARFDDDRGEVSWNEQLARTPLQLVTFGVTQDAELLLVDHSRSQQIYRLVRNTAADQASHEFPHRLSQTGLFANTATQQPAPGVV